MTTHSHQLSSSTRESGAQDRRRVDIDPKWMARACDFSDIWDLAISPGRHNEFRLSSTDDANQITMHTKAVASSPIHLMKACAVMPCAPRAFLRYLDMDVRSLWDEHFLEGVVLSDTIATVPLTAVAAVPNSSHTTEAAAADAVTQVHVQMKHVAFASPIPLLLHRDFELVIGETLRPDGVAILKAFSPPVESVVPARPEYVRGLVSISGFVAVPHRYFEARLGRKVDGCRVTYIALVHPMGLIPSFLVNTVIGKQTSALKHLQDFIAKNPLTKLADEGRISSATDGAKCGVVMRRMGASPGGAAVASWIGKDRGRHTKNGSKL